MADLINEKAKPPQHEQGSQRLEKEVVLKSGETVKLPYIHIDRMRLFHGSPISGISEFTDAEETTIGYGLYTTSDKNTASGYAIVRSSNEQDRFLYELEINNMNILDLTTRDAMENFALLLKESVLDWKDKAKVDGSLEWFIDGIVYDIVFAINTKQFRGLRDITFSVGDIVRNMLTERGFDGLKANEGGESGNGIKIGKHDSYVIFDSKKARVIKEEPVQQTIVA